jgi:hypothetical protein
MGCHQHLSAARRGYVIKWCLLVIILVTGACSFRFVYRQLDWLVPWRLSDYVTFDASQHSLLEQRLMEQLEWHCSTQLTAYAEWFRELRQAPQPLSRDAIERHYLRTVEFWGKLMRALTPDVVALLQSASDEQVTELFANLEERNRELEEEYVSASWETVQARRTERMSEILRRWLGPLTEAQQQAVAVWARELGQQGAAWIASRRRWQAALRESLALRPEAERFHQRIEQLLLEPERLWPADYRREYARMRSRTLDLLAQVAELQTPVQRQHLRAELDAWSEDFEHLSCSEPDAGRGAGITH